MTDELVMKYFSLSNKIRNQYIESLGTASQTWIDTFIPMVTFVPPIFQAIYSRVEGTHRDIVNQKHMDFVPGYRLIHIEELENEYHTLLKILDLDDVCEARIEMIIPLLADYSSCYICYAETIKDEKIIFHYSPSDGIQRMHNSIELFFKTLIAFYEKGVFYLDEDGFLSYDFEKQGAIGAEYNPDVSYWTE